MPPRPIGASISYAGARACRNSRRFGAVVSGIGHRYTPLAARGFRARRPRPAGQRPRFGQIVRAMTGHQPYVPPSQSPAELTPRALILGVVLGLVFGASNVYLALKIGLTVSASIPIAVLSITIFRALGRASILENNIVQTTGSASDSVAAGVVFTIPAVLLMGYDLEIGRVATLATVGGLMGVLMMIPLRRALIVKEHDTLIYPEGTACAEVLIAGEERGLQAKRVFQAFGVGFVYKFLQGGLKFWPDVPGK